MTIDSPAIGMLLAFVAGAACVAFSKAAPAGNRPGYRAPKVDTPPGTPTTLGPVSAVPGSGVPRKRTCCDDGICKGHRCVTGGNVDRSKPPDAPTTPAASHNTPPDLEGTRCCSRPYCPGNSRKRTILIERPDGDIPGLFPVNQLLAQAHQVVVAPTVEVEGPYAYWRGVQLRKARVEANGDITVLEPIPLAPPQAPAPPPPKPGDMLEDIRQSDPLKAIRG